MSSGMRPTMLRLGLLILASFIFLMAGCSVNETAITAGDPPGSGMRASDSSHSLLGLWQFVADPDAGTLDVVQLRAGDFHLNALVFLEPPPMINLSLESLEFNGDLIDCEIGLRHPFLGLTEFSGFDVCGVLITNGTQTGFTDPDIRMAGDGDTRLLNPDGLTRWWNPSEFPHGGTMLSYVDGMLGAPDSFGQYNCTLNAFKYFCDGLSLDGNLDEINMERRGLFNAGSKNIRRYLLQLGTEGLIFNYAVDACWQFPNGDYPWKAPDDFAPEANRPEAYRISVGELDKTLFYDPVLEQAEGEVTLLIDVYDWFNADLNEVTIECGDIFVPLSTSTTVGGGLGFSTYQIDILDAQPTTAGPIDIFITVASEDIGYSGFLPGKPVASYFWYRMDIPLGSIEQPFPCGELYTEDNFDSYANGTYPLPAPWVNFWSGYPLGCYVTNEQCVSPPHSWRASDYTNWARYDGIPMTRQDHFCYEVMVMRTNIEWRAKIGFAWKKSGSTTGHFCAYTMYGPDYNMYQWYHVYGEIDCIENTWKLWVDDELLIDTSWTDETAEYTFTHFFIGTGNHDSLPGNSIIYFDDVKFWVDQ